MKKSTILENDKRLQALRMFINAIGVKYDCQDFGYISGVPHTVLNVYDVTAKQEYDINYFIELLY